MSDTRETLRRVHALLAEQMLLLLEHGRPVYEDGQIVDWNPVTPQEMQAIIKFLDNNSIDAAPADAGRGTADAALTKLMEAAQANIAKGRHLQ